MSNLENGIKAENMIAGKLHFRNQEIEQNHTWGIDIILNRKNKKFGLGIPTLLTKIKKLDFSEVIEFG